MKTRRPACSAGEAMPIKDLSTTKIRFTTSISISIPPTRLQKCRSKNIKSVRSNRYFLPIRFHSKQLIKSWSYHLLYLTSRTSFKDPYLIWINKDPKTLYHKIMKSKWLLIDRVTNKKLLINILQLSLSFILKRGSMYHWIKPLKLVKDMIWIDLSYMRQKRWSLVVDFLFRSYLIWRKACSPSARERRSLKYRSRPLWWTISTQLHLAWLIWSWSQKRSNFPLSAPSGFDLL